MIKTYTDSVREEQAREGRRLAQEDAATTWPQRKRTLHVKKPPMTAKVKGHEALLKDLKESGGVITISFQTEDKVFVGTVKASDAYTVSVEGHWEHPNVSLKLPNPPAKTHVFFKHAILSIELPARPDTKVNGAE